MAVARSPNYPFLSLGEALAAIRPVLKAEHRNKMSREVLATHLGYSSISGRALAKMGALKAYGLIEGQQDETRVSEDALICVEAPEDDPDRAEALRRCAMKPTIFKEIGQAFATTPSEHNLRFWLIKRGYNPEAAGKAVQTYLATMRLVDESSGAYNPTSDESLEGGETADETPQAKPPISPEPKREVAAMDGERVAFTEESQPGQYLKLIASGEVDDFMLEALEDYVKRQRRRLSHTRSAPAGDRYKDDPEFGKF